jgi:hypothetical protein
LIISVALNKEEQTVVVYSFNKIVENGIAVYKKNNEK